MKKDTKKNLMKRIVTMITAAVMLFSLAAFAACSKKQDDTEIRIAALKGPTGMGMVKLADKQNYPNYTVSIEASPDALNPRIISGEVDVAAVPVNLASVLYNKLDGDISVLAVSTLGVLYVVEAGSEVNSVADLAGKTVYATGQGATPEYILNYLLDKNGVAGSVEVNYVGEHAALATMLADGSAGNGRASGTERDVNSCRKRQHAHCIEPHRGMEQGLLNGACSGRCYCAQKLCERTSGGN
ncbi:MAG: hypothetical protein V8Q89_00625 [Christensenellales bacterium]